MPLVDREITTWGNGAKVWYTFDDVLLEVLTLTVRNPSDGTIAIRLKNIDELKSFEQVVEKELTDTVFIIPPGTFKMEEVKDFDQDDKEIFDWGCVDLQGVETGWT